MARGIRIADWNGQVLPEIIRQLEDFRQTRFSTYFKRKMDYNFLISESFLKQREHIMPSVTTLPDGEKNGTLPRDCFADHTRDIIQDFDDDYEGFRRLCRDME